MGTSGLRQREKEVPCSALGPAGAGRLDQQDWEKSSRPSTCLYCPVATQLYRQRIFCRLRTLLARLRLAPTAALADGGRRRICVSLTRRRFRFANSRWRDRPFGGPVVSLQGQ